MHVAADVGWLNQHRQRVSGCGFDLAKILAQFGRDEVELQLGVNFFFGRARDRLLVFERSESIFVKREAHLKRALPQRYVVRLGAGEILHGRSEGLGRQQAHIDLHAIAMPEADFILSLRDDVH